MARTAVSLGHPSLHLDVKPKRVMHEMFTPLVSAEVDLLSDAAEATKVNALASKQDLLGLAAKERHLSFFSLGFFFHSKKVV